MLMPLNPFPRTNIPSCIYVMRVALFLVGCIQLPAADALSSSATANSNRFSRGNPLFSQQQGAPTIPDNAAESRGQEREKAIVVGGGPVGLASAIMLANEGFDVSVFEATPTENIKVCDPALAYQYNVNARGQVFTKMFPNIHQKLVERNLPSTETGATIAVADVTKPIKYPKNRFGGNAVSYWVPRHEMNLLLWDSVDDHNNARDPNSHVGEIRFEPGTKCVNVHPSADEQSHITVTVQNVETGNQKEISGNLVVGADGINSKVRECLKEKQGEFGTWGYKAKKFQLKKHIHPASGLKFKALQFPADKYEIMDSDGKRKKVQNSHFCIVNSAKTGPLDTLSFPSLPTKETTQVRYIQCITRPNHIVWTLKTGPEVKNLFTENFPRIDFDSMVSNDEWDRFAKARSKAFPPCQYCPALQASAENGESGVVLLGDAAHSFSPDTGQGVNAGLLDVVQLQKALVAARGDNSGSSAADGSLGTALKEYERVQAPETKALIRIARFGAPYQYDQSPRKDRLGKKVWLANVMFKLFLKKITFGLFPGQVMSILRNNDLTYRQVARRADAGTAVLASAFTIAAFKMLSSLL